jgi:hypothetical protein
VAIAAAQPLHPNIMLLVFDKFLRTARTKKKTRFIEYLPRFQERSEKLGQLLVEN